MCVCVCVCVCVSVCLALSLSLSLIQADLQEAELLARRDTIRIRLSEKRTLMAVRQATIKTLSEDAEVHDYHGADGREL